MNEGKLGSRSGGATYFDQHPLQAAAAFTAGAFVVATLPADAAVALAAGPTVGLSLITGIGPGATGYSLVEATGFVFSAWSTSLVVEGTYNLLYVGEMAGLNYVNSSSFDQRFQGYPDSSVLQIAQEYFNSSSNGTLNAGNVVSSDFAALGLNANNGIPFPTFIFTPSESSGFPLIAATSPDAAPIDYLNSGFSALNGGSTPSANDVVASDFNALNASSAPNPNDVVASDYSALNVNGALNANDVVASDFSALSSNIAVSNSDQTSDDDDVLPSNSTPTDFQSTAPAFTLPNAFPVNDAVPIGYINPAAFQSAFYDPATFEQASSASSFNLADDGSAYNPINSGGDDSGGGDDGGDGGYDGGNGDDGDGYGPIVLDVAGLVGQSDTGIQITPLTSSNTFFDMTGGGEQNLTAWAGKGNGVLFYDPTSTGQLTQEKQIVFTDWDPGATSDMQALEDVFDTNHDGALDSGDADFSDFYVMVTNANGTETAYSLASLGITSINLNADTTDVALPDGSSIDGETTYTTSGGATGAAATVTFAVDPNGYAVTTTTTTNADGSTTIDNVALNPDGSVAYSRILNTSSNGLSQVLTDLNAGGVVTTIQTDVTSGSTQTVTNYEGGAITSTGELTSAGVSSSEELNSTATTSATISGGTVVTILRDQLGGGWTTQQEVDTYNSGGSLSSIVVSDLTSGGSASNVTSTTMVFTSSGSTQSVTSLVDGLAADSTTSVDQIVVSGGTQTETVTDSVGTTVTSLVTTVTQTSQPVPSLGDVSGSQKYLRYFRGLATGERVSEPYLAPLQFCNSRILVASLRSRFFSIRICLAETGFECAETDLMVWTASAPACAISWKRALRDVHKAR
jgi:hypothetical protein